MIKYRPSRGDEDNMEIRDSFDIDVAVRTYVKLCYKSNDKDDNRTKENPIIRVNNRNPEFLKDTKLLKCQFFDVTEVYIDGEKITGQMTNMSPIIHFGKRTKVEELDRPELLWINKMIAGLGIDNVILYDDNSFIVPNENDITYDEHVRSLSTHSKKLIK